MKISYKLMSRKETALVWCCYLQRQEIIVFKYYIKVRCNFNSDETFNMLCIFYFIENEIKDKDWC